MANGGQVPQWDLQAMARIHIVGASGTGTSTLGAALARRLGYPHIDADALFWKPTDPPFTTPRPADDRQALLRHRLPITDPWVFSGSALKWAASLEPFHDPSRRAGTGSRGRRPGHAGRFRLAAIAEMRRAAP